MTRRKRNIIVGVLVFLLTGIGFIVWFGYQVVQVPRNAYAVWWTADLVIDHLEKHGGSWPQNWDELQATSEQTYQGTTSTNRDGTMIAEFRPRDTIEELKQRVEIDWKADPKTLAKAEFKAKGPPFRVIWLRNGKTTHYSGKEPNRMILEYLKWKSKEPTATEPAPSANPNQPVREGNAQIPPLPNPLQPLAPPSAPPSEKPCPKFCFPLCAQPLASPSSKKSAFTFAVSASSRENRLPAVSSLLRALRASV